MSKIAKKFRSLKRQVNRLSKKSGLSKSAAFFRLVDMRLNKQISPKRYVRDELWLLDEAQLSSDLKNKVVRSVAKEKGISYARALQLMDMVKRDYGVPYEDFLSFGLSRFKQEENLRKKAAKLASGSLSSVDKVVQQTGWSHEKAQARMEEVQAQYPLVTKKFFAEHNFGSLSDEQIESRMKKLNPERKPNRYVSLVAREKELSYADALLLMEDIYERFNVSFYEFASSKLYRYQTQIGLEKRAAAMQEKEKRHIERASYEGGMSYDEAEARMKRIKERYPSITYRKFVGYGFFAMTDEQIAERVKLWDVNLKKYQDHAMAATGWPREKVRAHMTRAQVVYDIIPAYYNCYQAWNLSDEQLESYARQKHSERISKIYNNQDDKDKMGDKAIFDDVYAEFVNRKHWVNRNSSFEEFQAFAEGIDRAFCKPTRSGGGLGAFTLDLPKDEAAQRELYDDLMAKPLVLVEELVQQHPEISEFYPDSVNTIRVVTILTEEGPKIISTGMRFGQYGVTDNFSSGGMVSDVDIETGVLVTNAVDKAGIEHKAHPFSGKEFIGFKVPNWDMIIDAAKRAMYVLEGVNYVGWDFAICEDKVCIIEGNSMPDLVLVQAPYAPQQIGKKYLFEPYLKK